MAMAGTGKQEEEELNFSFVTGPNSDGELQVSSDGAGKEGGAN